jgi:Tfp pilus assembly protein PilO
MLDRIRELPLRARIGLIIACLAVTAFLIVRVVVSPVLERAVALDHEIEELSTQVAHNRRVMGSAAAVDNSYAVVADMLGASGPAAETVEQLKADLDEMAARSGVGLKSMRDFEPVESEYLVTYQIEISEFAAKIADLLRFFQSVQAAPGMLRIEKLSIANNDTDQIVQGSFLVTKVMTHTKAISPARDGVAR